MQTFTIATKADPTTILATVSAAELMATCEKFSPDNAVPLIIAPFVAAPEIDTSDMNNAAELVSEDRPVNSTWTHQVTDEAAKARIEAQHESLRASGIAVQASQQLYSTGTRMADVGYCLLRAFDR
jgi:hypothetical protein